ncbi:DUF3180 domain-containing protein [Corynebacterium doosanense]|uniref:DUF3180 domain-containing protein n=1 Tax=Corynebacterium doosanense CAU 212 = DSM 45436 TaxID=558173 RepID=A0A097II88_9CORY|nr:DUF3180 domain-containing protein [Corynebacterium doosanense]AIT61849.1 hypothetical protein CDOO_11700 [Corynebacterium doosanense CAU 212 = DSM 45436]
MNRTSLGALAGTFVFLAAAFGILTWRFYGSFPPIPAAGAVTVWLLVAVVVVLILLVRRADIGLDRTQLDPITVARMMIVGKASAWTGAVLGGLYSGVATYVIPQAGILAAAQDEAPVVLAAALGSLALSVAGVVLERHCEAPPPLDGQTVS